jgi:hypothetical protein
MSTMLPCRRTVKTLHGWGEWEETAKLVNGASAPREGAFLPLSKAWLCVTLLVLGHPVALATHVTVGVLRVGYAADPVSVIA